MDKKNKWGLFRNFLYNELDISKEDIRDWVKEAVQEEARRMIDQGFSPRAIIMKELEDSRGYNGLKEEITREIKKAIQEQFLIEVSYLPAKSKASNIPQTPSGVPWAPPPPVIC